MGLVNRSKDESEQKELVCHRTGLVGTGVNVPILQCPRPMELEDVKIAAAGLSGSPTVKLQIQRFVEDAGLTTFAIGPDLTIQAIGTSGPQTFGISAATLQKNDVLTVTTGTANTAADDYLISAVVKTLQDIKQWY